MATLEAHKLAAGYGGIAAVRGLDLEVRGGQVVALLGANGAGKTTTLMTLAGALPAVDGEIRLEGQRLRGSLNKRARAGVILVPEGRSVFMGMSARDNIRVGRGSADLVLEIFPDLRDHLHRKAGLLSGGQQQMLTVGRALASQPKALLVDELSLGLAPLMVKRLLDVVRVAAAEQGVAILLVEQHIRAALDISDYVYVLRRGRVALQGTAQELRQRTAEIERAYLHGPDDAA